MRWGVGRGRQGNERVGGEARRDEVAVAGMCDCGLVLTLEEGGQVGGQVGGLGQRLKDGWEWKVVSAQVAEYGWTSLNVR